MAYSSKLPKVELLMMLEHMRSRTGSDRYRASLKQAEDIIRHSEKMRDALRDMIKLHNDMAKNLRHMVIQDYALLNNAPIAAQKAVVDHYEVLPAHQLAEEEPA